MSEDISLITQNRINNLEETFSNIDTNIDTLNINVSNVNTNLNNQVTIINNSLTDINTTITNNQNETNTKIDNVNNDLLAIIDSLTKRIQTLESQKHIVQTWSSGTSWYRVWSDGWIEQGNRISASASTLADKKYTFNLVKSFTTTNYYFSNVLVYTNSTSNWGAGCCGVVTKTVSQVTVMADGINTSHPISGFDYYACGY